MKKLFNFGLISFVLVLALGVFFVGSSKAMESSSSAVAKYGIIFPVVELGSCKSLNECKTFCNNLANKDACIAFAKKKGFYSPSVARTTSPAHKPNPSIDTTIIEAAKKELGCDSADACRTFCGDQQNWIKCGEFAKRHSLGNPPPKGQDKISGDEMRDKCHNLAQKMGSASAEEIKSFYLKNCVQNKPSITPRPLPSPKDITRVVTPKPTIDPAARCSKYPGYAWNGSYCQLQKPEIAIPSSTSSNIKGVSLDFELLQSFLRFLGL